MSGPIIHEYRGFTIMLEDDGSGGWLWKVIRNSDGHDFGGGWGKRNWSALNCEAEGMVDGIIENPEDFQ